MARWKTKIKVVRYETKISTIIKNLVLIYNPVRFWECLPPRLSVPRPRTFRRRPTSTMEWPFPALRPMTCWSTIPTHSQNACKRLTFWNGGRCWNTIWQARRNLFLGVLAETSFWAYTPLGELCSMVCLPSLATTKLRCWSSFVGVALELDGTNNQQAILESQEGMLMLKPPVRIPEFLTIDLNASNYKWWLNSWSVDLFSLSILKRKLWNVILVATDLQIHRTIFDVFIVV